MGVAESSRCSRFPVLLSGLVAALAGGCGDSPGTATPCEAGTYGRGDGDCAPCAAGTYCPAGAAAAIDCVAGESWDDDADPATDCLAVTTCAAGEYESMGPTATRDRVCSGLTDCTASEYESTPPTATTDRVCMAHAVCEPGAYVSAAGTATSDQVCTGCTSGTFSDAADAASCAAWTVCAAGTYVETAGTATSDQICAPCAAGTYTAGQNQSACVPYDACAPGTVQTAAGDGTMPPTCVGCSAGEHCAGDTAPAAPCDDGDGTWDHDGDPATACVARTECAAGSYVSHEGDALDDRSCTACAAGTYTDAANQSVCVDQGVCPAGTVQTAAGSSTSPPSCADCAAGEYCAGDTASAVLCDDGDDTWDDDGDPATACVTKTVCGAGSYVASGGDATTDRSCAACAAGEFSDADDAVSCTPWTACDPGYVEGTPGSSTTDRACVPEWIRQFGTASNDFALSVTLGGAGDVLVAGYTLGTLPGESSAGSEDAFLGNYASDGTLLWTEQFGTAAQDYAFSVSVDGAGNVLVAGYTYGTLPGETSAGGQDAFVRKYASDGTLLWTEQFGTASQDYAYSVGVDGAGNVLVAGYTYGTLPGETSAGGQDAFVRRYASDGTLLWTEQFGTASIDLVSSASVDGEGNVLVAGYTFGTLPGESSAGGYDAYVRKYGSDGTLLWTDQFGTAATEEARSVSVDGAGNVLVAGYTGGTLPGESSAGNNDAFVRKYASDGTLVWTEQFGTAYYDYVRSVNVDGEGNVLVAGETSGALPGGSSAGGFDAFVRKYGSDGTVLWTEQFGTTSGDAAYSVSVDGAGDALVAGITQGTFSGQSSAGSFDAFVGKLASP